MVHKRHQVSSQRGIYPRRQCLTGKWQLDIGMNARYAFGGSIVDSNGNVANLGNTLKDYFRVFIPGAGDEDKPWNDSNFFQGNFLGSEQIRLTHRSDKFSISAYLCNHFDDFIRHG